MKELGVQVHSSLKLVTQEDGEEKAHCALTFIDRHGVQELGHHVTVVQKLTLSKPGILCTVRLPH